MMPNLKIAVFLIILTIQVQANYFIKDGGFLYSTKNLAENTKHISFLMGFRTEKHNGILFHLKSQNSEIIIQLYYGSLGITLYEFSKGFTQIHLKKYIGSGLADGELHQIEFVQLESIITVVVDRGEKIMTSYNSQFSLRLTLDPYYDFYIGNSPILNNYIAGNLDPKMNFVGCIEHMTLNGFNGLSDVLKVDANNSCQPPLTYPLAAERQVYTFNHVDSYIELKVDSKKEFSLKFDLLIYSNSTEIVNQTYLNQKLVISTTDLGNLRVQVFMDEILSIDAVQNKVLMNDGSWHEVFLKIPNQLSTSQDVVFIIDDRYKISAISPIHFFPNSKFIIGNTGFRGCMRNIIISNELFVMDSNTNRASISVDGCRFSFQCLPMPCIHFGACISNGPTTYFCQCEETFTGVQCQDSILFQSCYYLHQSGERSSGKKILDVDGPGYLTPMRVDCMGMESNFSDSAITSIKPKEAEYFFELSPEFKFIEYEVLITKMRELITLSEFCVQEIVYECTNSPITNRQNITYFNWLGGDGQLHDYLNSEGILGKCECSIGSENMCNNFESNCNCDVSDFTKRLDLTTFLIKEHLPIVGLNLNMISAKNSRSVKIKIGPLRCRGTSRTSLAITFGETFSYINIPILKYEFGVLSFFFKTNLANGNVILFIGKNDDSDFIQLSIINKNTIGTKIRINNERFELNVTGSLPLNDNYYHSCKLKVLRNYIEIAIDNVTNSLDLHKKVMDRKEETNIDILINTNIIYLGGTPFDRFSGFRGSIRELLNSHSFVDFSNIDLGLNYDIAVGEELICKNNNLCNFGDCIENYNYYKCNCTVTPMYGRNCEQERGIMTQSTGFALRYTFPELIDIEEMVISMGFTTASDGVLFMLVSEDPTIFIFAAVSSGNVSIMFNTKSRNYFNVNQKIFEAKDMGFRADNNERHIMRITISPRQFIFNIDKKEFKVIFDLAALQFIFKKAQFLYVGGYDNFDSTVPTFPEESSAFPTQKSFNGCISGMKAFLRQPNQLIGELIDTVDIYYRNPQNIVHGNLIKSKCGHDLSEFPYSELLPLPINLIPSTRDISSNRIPLEKPWGPTVLGLAVFTGLLIVLATTLLLKWYTRTRGKYYTDEGSKKRKTNFNRSSVNSSIPLVRSSIRKTGVVYQ